MLGGGVLEYPWAGCSNDRPGCCPFDPKVGGVLNMCPSDYYTTSSACCPTGWTIHTSSVGGQLPCVSTLTSPLAAPSVTGLRKRVHRVSDLPKRAPVSVVVTSQLYTQKYALKAKKAGLSAGAKAGIAVGIVVASIFGALLVALIIKKRKRRNQGLREGTIIGGGSMFSDKRSGTFSQAGSHPGHMSDMHMQQGIPVGGGFWIPPPAPARDPTPPPPPIPIQELPASTHIHEHHPAFQPSGDAPQPPPAKALNTHDDAAAALVSPLDPPNRN
ncbi:MAG: hypothetical protein Q9174_003630 [Haloplaca sp. 1 TL-2023]